MIKRIINKICDKIIVCRIRLCKKNIKKKYYLSQKYWSRKGVVFLGERAIAVYDANLDISVPNMIEIGDNSQVTADVTIMVHDYSIQKGLEIIDKDFKNHTVQHVAKVTIGKNCFVGHGAILLPGTIIGDNSIVGAGSICRGSYPPNSIIMGNPAIVVSNTVEWANKKEEDYYTFGSGWNNFPRK